MNKLLLIISSIILLISCAPSVKYVEFLEENPVPITNTKIDLSPNININIDSVQDPFMASHTMEHSIFPDRTNDLPISVKEAIRKHILAKLKDTFGKTGKDGELTILVESLSIKSKNNMPVCLALIDCLFKTFLAGAEVETTVKFTYVVETKEVFSQRVTTKYDSERALKTFKDGGETPVDVIKENIGKSLDQALENLMSQLKTALNK